MEGRLTSKDEQAPKATKNEVYTWGEGSWGQLGHGTTTNERIPRLVTSLRSRRITHVSVGTAHSIAIAGMINCSQCVDSVRELRWCSNQVLCTNDKCRKGKWFVICKW